MHREQGVVGDVHDCAAGRFVDGVKNTVEVLVGDETGAFGDAFIDAIGLHFSSSHEHPLYVERFPLHV